MDAEAIDRLVSDAAQRSGHSRDVWRAAMNRCRPDLGAARIGSAELSRILEVADPEHLPDFVALLGRGRRHPADPSPLEQVEEAAEPHPYHLGAWIAGVVVVGKYLETRGRRANLGQILGFLQCCAEAGTCLPGPASLPDLAAGMLEQHGMAEES